MSISEHSTSNTFALKVLIYGTALLSVMGVTVIMPVMPQMMEYFAIDEADMGILVYSFTLPGIIFAPVGGILADRWGRKCILLCCLILFTVGGVMASFAETFSTLIFWRVVQGMGAASLGVLYTIIVGDIYQEEHARLKVMGYAATTLSLGAAIFPALGGLLGEISWQWSLRLALLALPLFILAWNINLPQSAPHGDMSKYIREVRKLILRPKSLMHFAITFCAFSVLYGPLVSFFPLLSDMHYKATSSQIGIIFALSSLGTVAATVFLAPVVKRFSATIIAVTGAFCFLLCMIMLLFWQYELSYWLLIVPILCYGIGQGLLYPITINSLSSLAPDTGRGALMAVNGTILRLSQSFSPFVCGIIFVHAAFGGVFFFGISMAALMLFLAFYAFLPCKKVDISS